MLAMFFNGPDNPLKLPFHMWDLDPYLILSSLCPSKLCHPTKRHLNQFSHFCRAHERDRQTDRHTDTYRPRYSVCTTRLHLAIAHTHTYRQTDRETDRQTHTHIDYATCNICINMPHLRTECTRCGLKNRNGYRNLLTTCVNCATWRSGTRILFSISRMLLEYCWIFASAYAHFHHHLLMQSHPL